MKKNMIFRFASGLLILVAVSACTAMPTVKGNLNVIPQPQEIMLAQDTTPFVLDCNTVIVYSAGNEKLQRTAGFLAASIKETTGAEVRVSDKEKNKNVIVLAVDSTMPEKEGYTLSLIHI